jgi:hypothetical protein
MRTLAVVLTATALLIPSARAAEVVEIGRPRIVFITPDATANTCGKPSRRGCTTLQTEFLCACAQAGDKWTLAPHLIATAVLYTTTQDIVRHELEHIADIRGSLNEYAGALMLRSFDTQQSCSSFVDEEKKTFANTLRNIQRLTTVKRDGVQFADRAGDR